VEKQNTEVLVLEAKVALQSKKNGLTPLGFTTMIANNGKISFDATATSNFYDAIAEVREILNGTGLRNANLIFNEVSYYVDTTSKEITMR